MQREGATGGNFAGQVALVTGAGSGLGAVTARLLAGNGARVVLADLDKEAAGEVAEGLGSADGEGVGGAVEVQLVSQLADGGFEVLGISSVEEAVGGHR